MLARQHGLWAGRPGQLAWHRAGAGRAQASAGGMVGCGSRCVRVRAHLQRGRGELWVAHAAVAGHAAAGDVGVDHVVGAQGGHLGQCDSGVHMADAVVMCAPSVPDVAGWLAKKADGIHGAASTPRSPASKASHMVRTPNPSTQVLCGRQHGTHPGGRPTFMNDSSMPIFLEEQGMCTATLSRTRLNSSLSSRKWRMNSTGSYSENLPGQRPGVQGSYCWSQLHVGRLWSCWAG